MGKTSIEWTDHSWPVVNGCRRVSAGCTNCYAERLTATRLSRTPKYKGLAVFGKNGPRWSGKSRLWVPHLDAPLRVKKPSRFFVADMGDLFYDGVDDEVIDAVFGVMAACPQHTFQVLTKRPERAREWFQAMQSDEDGPGADHVGHRLLALLSQSAGFLRRDEADHLRAYDELARRVPDNRWPLPNVWIGVSCEDQATADQRIPELLATPAAVRFVSAEPLLGPVDLSPWLGYDETWDRYVGPCAHGRDPWTRCEVNCTPGQVEGLDWVIVGGESGPGARPFDLAWGRALVDQCGTAGVACFVKQLGARPVDAGQPWSWNMDPMDRKGGDPNQWPDALRVRQFPAARSSIGQQKQEAPPAGGPVLPGIPAR